MKKIVVIVGVLALALVAYRKFFASSVKPAGRVSSMAGGYIG